MGRTLSTMLECPAHPSYQLLKQALLKSLRLPGNYFPAPLTAALTAPLLHPHIPVFREEQTCFSYSSPHPAD